MDYHIIGFRECAAEVARYLINIEGMDIQDPLRMRLISHLQCFVAQREITAKTQNTTGATTAWPPTTPASATHHSTPYALTHHQSAYGTTIPPSALPPLPPSSTSSATVASATSPMYHQSGSGTYPPSHYIPNHYIPNLAPAVSSAGTILCETQTSTSTTTQLQSDSNALLSHQQSAHYSQHEDQNGSTYTDLSANIHRNASVSIGYGNPHYPSSGAQGYNSNGAPTSPGGSHYNNNNKPYRPWGTGPEMAY